MNDKTNKPNTDKRATLKRLGKTSAGTAAMAAIGTSEWVRPIVSQVVLPAHAQTTSCAGLQVTAIPGRCSSGMPVDIFIASTDSTPLQITSVPSIQATPTTEPAKSGSWDSTTGAAVPATITDVDEYVVTTRGQVMSEDICSTPATGTPNSTNQRPLTALELTIEYVCSADGKTETVTVDILPQIAGG